MFISQAPKYLQTHPKYSNSEYGKLRRRGLKNSDIKELWDTQQGHESVLAKIAEQHLFVETLKTQNSDSLDFHDVSVWGIKAALEAAYKAGAQSTEVAA